VRDERIVKRVSNVGPVQRDTGNPARFLDQEIRHAMLGSTDTALLTELAM
jgi:hypothetical protein